ncbi:MAG: hypothetical protein M1393_07200 [Candidatus Thermoplasmatota archaeon]|nr:hypothetical protein [Candidatus Thermoplasmatota archaeon]
MQYSVFLVSLEVGGTSKTPTFIGGSRNNRPNEVGFNSASGGREIACPEIKEI